MRLPPCQSLGLSAKAPLWRLKRKYKAIVAEKFTIEMQIQLERLNRKAQPPNIQSLSSYSQAVPHLSKIFLS